MFLLGHIGIGLGLAWLATHRRLESIDYRFVILGTILPDLIDKPLGFLLNLQGRLVAHTLLFLVGLLVLSRIPRARKMQWVGFGVATHLLLDEIWQLPNVALWPFDGPFRPSHLTVWSYLYTLLTDPLVQFGEVTGTLVLVTMAWAYGIRSWAALRLFLGTGRLGKPVPTT